MDVDVRRVQQIVKDVPYLKYKRMISGPIMNTQHTLELVSLPKNTFIEKDTTREMTSS